MTQLIHEPLIAVATEPWRARSRNGVVFVPCAICRGPVDLGAAIEANNAPVCEKHFVTERPQLRLV